jgi:glc operon protein GlcG
MHTKPVLSSANARNIVDKALTAAEEAGYSISVAVVDDGGYLLAMQKAQNAGKLTAKVAIEKARTAALMRGPSGVLQNRVKEDPALLRLTDYLPMAGGLPVMHGGECAGAVGISGGTAEQDIEIAEAALTALGG